MNGLLAACAALLILVAAVGASLPALERLLCGPGHHRRPARLLPSRAPKTPEPPPAPVIAADAVPPSADAATAPRPGSSPGPGQPIHHYRGDYRPTEPFRVVSLSAQAPDGVALLRPYYAQHMARRDAAVTL